MLATLWNTILFHPFLNLLIVSYHFLGDNLGWAVVVLAIFVRLLLIPSVRNQVGMTKKMADLKPRLDKLQKKYANNKEKLAQEQMKLYKEVGYNPLGCIGSFIPQMLILYVMFQVIRVVVTNDITGLYQPVVDMNITMPLDTNFFMIDLAKTFSDIKDVDKFGYFIIERIPYFILAISVGIAQFLSTKFMQKIQNVQSVAKKKGKKDDQMDPSDMQTQMNKSMTSIFPVMTAYITLMQPSVLGLYWLVQSLMLTVQYFIIDRQRAVTVFNDIVKSKLGKIIKKK